MKRVCLFLAVLGLCAISTSCNGADSNPERLCRNLNQNQICGLPFEAALLKRGELLGRNIRVAGFLVIGVESEPPGSSRPVMLLFPSLERANLCDLNSALELTDSTGKIYEKMKQNNGAGVSVAGKFDFSSGKYWAKIDMSSEPSLIFNNQNSSIDNCMMPPPHMLPEEAK